jgi:hypothetical protein
MTRDTPYSPAATPPGLTLILAGLLAATILLVYGRLLSYPLIQDDWIRLEQALTPDTAHMLKDEFSPLAKRLYRPLGAVYFLALGTAFQSSAVGAHLVNLSLHLGSALLVAAIIGRITRDPAIGWLAAFLFAAAAYIHIDALPWASGIFDGASDFLGLLSLWLFLRGRSKWAALVYACALLFKEGVLFLPFVIGALALLDGRTHERGRLFHIVQRTWSFGAVFAFFAAVKTVGLIGLPSDPHDPYALRLVGPHVIRNLATYAAWSIRALWPSHETSSAAAAVVLIAAALLLSAGSLMTRTPESKNVARAVAVLAVWSIAALGMYLFLPNHVYVYYLTFGLPALFGLLLMGIRIAGGFLRLSSRVTTTVMVAATVASITSSFFYFRGIDRRGLDQPYVGGTNDLVRRAVTVTRVRQGLLAHEAFPENALLLFRNVDVWAFGKSSGPRLWYRDPTIRAYDVKDLSDESGTWTLFNADEAWLFPGQASNPVSAACCPLFLFEMTPSGLVERPITLSALGTLAPSRR